MLHGDNRPGRGFVAGVGVGVVMLMQTELVWLLGEVAKGDEVAFERLYMATRAKLYGVLLRILSRPALAEEVMQETYLKVWKMAAEFDPAIASPITWMVAMARNRAIDIVRKRADLSIEDEPEALEVASEAPPPLTRREMTEELKRLLSCLGKLDPEKQRIVLLAYYSGWSRDQLAQKLDIPVNTIKTWLRRSLLEIRECMGN
jgi:RNA polymerase sigma-70 factor (ECF subfamily)